MSLIRFVALLWLAIVAGCKQPGDSDLREVKRQACACRDPACAAQVGAALAKIVLASDLDSPSLLILDATRCLAAFGQ